MNNPFREIYLAELTKKQKKLDVDKDNKIEASDLAKLRAEELTKNQKKIDKNKNGQIDGQDFKLLRKEESDKPLGKGGKVETKKYSFGTMKTVHHGSDFSIPLHPEHHQAIDKLKDQQEHKFKDETGHHWTAKKSGDNIHFQGANGGGTTHVPAHTMKENYAPVAPTLDKKYIKGTPENKAAKAASKPINGMPTGKMKEEVEEIEEAKPGLYANINAKRKRIAAGSKEHMRKPGSKGAPGASNFKDAAKTANESLLSRIAEAAKKKACSDCGKMKCACMNEENLDELSKNTLNSYRDQAVDHKEKLKNNIARKTDHVQQMNNMGRDASGDKAELSTAQKLLKNRRSGIDKAGERLAKEEAELNEANHREFASQGKMHPDMAKHMSVGSEHDYYEHGTGDKVSGKVMHKSATEVHMKQTHDSYDPKKKGTVHKFKISDKMDEETISEAEGFTLHSKHTEADGTTTIVMKSPSGKMITHKGKGSAQAVKQRYGVQAEETELDEKINMKKAEMGDVIKDFEKSDAPQFKGKSAEKRRQMAIAAKLSNEELHMNSFKSYIQEDMDESMFPGSPEYKAKFGNDTSRGKIGSTKKTPMGTSTVTDTGVKHERDYEKAEKETSTPENQEKRGRGRPKGAASGARQKGSAAKSDDRYDSTGYKLHLPNKNR